jgi:hemerythrin
VDDFRWDCPLLVGVAQLDGQHRLLHRLIMSLIRTLETNPGDSRAEACFSEIFENMVEHFKAEEEYLENYRYPDLVPHRFEHELLLDWFQDQSMQRNAPNAPPLLRLVKLLAEIIQRHHETVDRAYATWLEEGGDTRGQS